MPRMVLDVTRLKLRKSLTSKRAGNRVRTDDLLITNQLLYQLSYAGFCRGCEKNHILAVAATICFQNATAKSCFQILNAAIHNRLEPEN
jgi:hypothetical protein